MNVLGYSVRWTHRPKSSVMGRFGGGWQWKVGVQAGGRTMIVSLVVSELRIEAPRKRVPRVVPLTPEQHEALRSSDG